MIGSFMQFYKDRWFYRHDEDEVNGRLVSALLPANWSGPKHALLFSSARIER